jgi:hypothetical protein
VNAGGGWADIGNGGEFCTGAGAIVHQRIEHAGAGWFGDGGGNPANGVIHSLMVDEAWRALKEYCSRYG